MHSKREVRGEEARMEEASRKFEESSREAGGTKQEEM